MPVPLAVSEELKQTHRHTRHRKTELRLIVQIDGSSRTHHFDVSLNISCFKYKRDAIDMRLKK